MDAIDSIVNTISGYLYTPWVPLFLIVGGLIFTFMLKGVQFRFFTESIRVATEKKTHEASTSSFGALMVSTASRVGTGNIVGVSTAICLGGPGAVFWMWMTALMGGASAFVESTLAQVYKKRDTDGSCYGGPSYYMEQALGCRWLGLIFAVIIILTYAVGYNMLAAYNLQSSFQIFSFYESGSTPFVIGVVLTACFALSVLGGLKQIVKVSAFLVPLMGVIYIGVALVAVVINISNVPAMIVGIIEDAFDFEAIFGGFAGSALMYGIKRGLYSNEAGMGSAPNAAASAAVSHPAKQGFVQMLSVFIDTLLICSATALMCLVSGVEPTAEVAGAVYVQKSVEATFGSFGPGFVAFAMVLFAFTTLIGNYYYCEGCLRFILNRKPGKGLLLGFRIAACALVLLGSVISMGLAWDTADMLQAMMVIINIPVILILSKTAVAVLNDYAKQRAAGVNPVFKASSIGLKQKTDFWN